MRQTLSLLGALRLQSGCIPTADCGCTGRASLGWLIYRAQPCGRVSRSGSRVPFNVKFVITDRSLASSLPKPRSRAKQFPVRRNFNVMVAVQPVAAHGFGKFGLCVAPVGQSRGNYHESPLGRMMGRGRAGAVAGMSSGLVVMMKRASSYDASRRFSTIGPSGPVGGQFRKPLASGSAMLPAALGRYSGLARRSLRKIGSHPTFHIFRNIVVVGFSVAGTMAVGQLCPVSVPGSAAVDPRVPGATVIGGCYLAERTFGT